jgi:hypothetical protein
MMSYCRWSSDNFLCDLYCYADVSGGWTTNVATRRYVGDIPPIDWSTDETAAASLEAQHAALQRCALEPIGLAHDGESFRDGDLEAFRATLLRLRAAGYRFSDAVLANVQDEIGDDVSDYRGADRD